MHLFNNSEDPRGDKQHYTKSLLKRRELKNPLQL